MTINGGGARRAAMVAERDVQIPMTDGIALAADLFRPASGLPAPVIMSMGPYGATTDPGHLTGRGPGTFLHRDPLDRPAPTFTGPTTLYTGGNTPARSSCRSSPPLPHSQPAPRADSPNGAQNRSEARTCRDDG